VNESAGVCGASFVDFNFNGLVDAPYARDLNSDGFMSQLHDHDDWAAIVYDWDGTFGSGGFAASVEDGIACPAPPTL
jgi:hypothetical protein